MKESVVEMREGGGAWRDWNRNREGCISSVDLYADVSCVLCVVCHSPRIRASPWQPTGGSSSSGKDQTI
jgi:hypothetical protein